MGRQERLQGLQVLRFVAALLVLVGHAAQEAAKFGIGDRLGSGILGWLPWAAGVDIFFVISGFIMLHISAGDFAETGASWRFLSKRVFRVVPLYWAFTSLMIVAMVAVPHALNHTHIDIGHIAASYAFLPWLDSAGLPHPVLGLGWTLNYEMYFYAVFALALLLPRKAALAAILGLFVLLTLINPLVPRDLVPLRFWSDPMILEFGLGMAIAAVWRRANVPLALAVSSVVVGAGLLIAATAEAERLGFPSLDAGALGWSRVVSAGVPAALIVFGVVNIAFRARKWPGRALVVGGDASYALYLSHPFTVNLVAIAWRPFRGALPEAGFTIVATIAAIAAAIGIHVIFERPVTRLLTAQLPPSGGAARQPN